MWRTVKWWLWFGALNFLIFLVFNEVLHIFINKDEEELALGIQIVIFGGLYSGRYLANLWIHLAAWIQHLISLGICLLILIVIFFMAIIFAHLTNHFEVKIFVVLCVLFLFLWINVGVLAKLIENQVNSRINNAEVQAANTKSELQLLQSQLSPHFLFNTLNNLYGISLIEHQKLPALLLKLSSLLRYSVYHSEETFVPLQDEIEYLNNYIDFEKIRLGDRLELKYVVEAGKEKGIKIAPMLLIVFVENAFKHAKNTQDEKIYIDIELKIWGDSVLFSLKNSHAQSDVKTEITDRNSGFGLPSVRKRLALLYANAHHLSIEESARRYTVMLRLNVK